MQRRTQHHHHLRGRTWLFSYQGWWGLDANRFGFYSAAHLMLHMFPWILYDSCLTTPWRWGERYILKLSPCWSMNRLHTSSAPLIHKLNLQLFEGPPYSVTFWYIHQVCSEERSWSLPIIIQKWLYTLSYFSSNYKLLMIHCVEWPTAHSLSGLKFT